MAATISYHAGTAGSIANLSGSGLGFFGASFGTSVSVGSYQDTTWITNGAGTSQGNSVENTKWMHAESGYNQAGLVNLQYIPNRLATLNVRFTNDSAVKVQNAVLKIFDRSSTANLASGVTTKVAELVHPDPGSAISNSSDPNWSTPVANSGLIFNNLSPGMSGQALAGDQTTDTQHDWYVVISASPDSIGAKTLFGLYTELEYL